MPTTTKISARARASFCPIPRVGFDDEVTTMLLSAADQTVEEPDHKTRLFNVIC
jgi:hypothetical protein